MTKLLELSDIASTRPLGDDEGYLISRKMGLLMQRDSGHNATFRLSIGDNCENHQTGEIVGTITELYRENGHNRASTKTGFYREQDLKAVASC